MKGVGSGMKGVGSRMSWGGGGRSGIKDRKFYLNIEILSNSHVSIKHKNCSPEKPCGI